MVDLNSSRKKISLFFSRMSQTPELAWQVLADDKRQELLDRLAAAGAAGQVAAEHLRSGGVRIGYYPQASSGAAWTWQGNIVLQPKARLDNPFTLSQLIHEDLHLQQPFFVRLSVLGELLAWQLDYRAYFEMTGRHYGEPGAPFHDSKAKLNAGRWAEIDALSVKPRSNLKRARELMIAIAPGYRANWLPLNPLWGLVPGR